MDESEAPGVEHGGLSRSELLKRGAIAGGLVMGGGLLGSLPEALAAAPKPKRGGSFRVGISGGGSGDTLDAAKLTSNTDYARLESLYDRPVYTNAAGSIANALAVEFAPNKTADEWTVRLRDGVEFHNGKSLSADDLIFTIRRVLDPKTASSSAAAIRFIDPNGLTKVDKLTVRLKLLAPTALVRENFSRLFWVVPVGYDPANPVGTGPFKFKSFTPGLQSVFERNPNYWRKGEPYVDELVLTNISDDTARLNALISGQVDAIDSIPFAQIPLIKGNKRLKLLVANSGNWRPITMRVDVPPFNDGRVRQAMKLIADRGQMIDQALAGQGRIANDLYSPYDPVYASDLPQRHQDIQQAKSLLKRAGRENLAVELVTSPIQAGLVQACQVFAQQAKAAGVTVKVTTLDPGSFFGAEFLQRPLSVDYWPTYPYLVQTAASQVPGAAYNEQHWNDATFNALYKQASRTLDPKKRREIAHKMQQIQYMRGGYLIWGFPNTVDAYSSRLSGLVPSKQGTPLGQYQLRSAYFA
jgi:peptide/nickel transport system substrate-binding protein